MYIKKPVACVGSRRPGCERSRAGRRLLPLESLESCSAGQGRGHKEKHTKSVSILGCTAAVLCPRCCLRAPVPSASALLQRGASHRLHKALEGLTRQLRCAAMSMLQQLTHSSLVRSCSCISSGCLQCELYRECRRLLNHEVRAHEQFPVHAISFHACIYTLWRHADLCWSADLCWCWWLFLRSHVQQACERDLYTDRHCRRQGVRQGGGPHSRVYPGAHHLSLACMHKLTEMTSASCSLLRTPSVIAQRVIISPVADGIYIAGRGGMVCVVSEALHQ